MLSKREILEFIKDAKDVYNKVVRILEGYDGASITFFDCSSESSILVDYNCTWEGRPFICIYLPAGPCWIEEGLPVLFDVKGAVYVEHYDDGIRVRVLMNLTTPRYSSSRVYGIEYSPHIERDEYKWLEEVFRNNIACTAVAEYIIVGNRVYQYGSEVGFSPFYITYPRNATEVEEVVVKNIDISYYGLLLKFKMIEEKMTIERCGKPQK
uniref:Uncharacterized protein n=1 Tax=Ignisphaera aggregans TaxID=334771 RepID=A0A7C4FAV7_9CREN